MSLKTISESLNKYNENYASLRIDPVAFSTFISEYKSFFFDLNKAAQINESEENIKNIINGFLKKAFYSSAEYTINTKNNIDSAISCNDKLMVMIEAKKPSNKTEMLNTNDINRKAFHELILYYLTESRNIDSERVKRNKDSEIKRLIVTNGFEWFVFDVNDIENLCDNYLERHYYKYKHNQLNYSNNNAKFYEDISEYLGKNNVNKIDFVYFDIRNLNNDKQYEQLCKILSATYLLKETPKLQIKEHTLNDKFYKELLYIMGLQEVKVKNKPQITINHDVENTFASQLYKKFKFDKDEEDEEVVKEKTFELIIIWLNRLLFIKLFEGQLISFNNDENEYHILSTDKIKSFEDLMNLFFNVLGRKNRLSDEFYDKFKQIPYLNSSLFEKQVIEKEDVNINEIRNENIAVKSNSIFGKKSPKMMPLLKYTIDFLNSYKFCSDSDESDSGNIIDAAVLGLIFEKINGYKDGAIYTPSVITEYMCKETLTRVVINKVNATLSWDCKSFEDISNMIRETDIKKRLSYRKKINDIINHITICDPAVGSGHFLVSALNFMIAAKQKIGVLFYNDSDVLVDDYTITVSNDVLKVIDGQEKEFSYDKDNAKSQKLQETLFNEKRTIIEQCLFGVDINPKAVYICQLRLWIELLKNAYYKKGVMETLPNIDIKLKVGDSLIHKINFEVGKDISRGSLEIKKADLKHYKECVKQYIATSDKSIKTQLRLTINKIIFDLHNAYEQLNLFEDTTKSFIDEDVFENAFEWAIAFPEIISEKGIFIGFDCVIGNPPYISAETQLSNKKLKKSREAIIDSQRFSTLNSKWDLYIPFMELGTQLIKENGIMTMIVPYPLTNQLYGKKIRELLTEKYNMFRIADLNNVKVFDAAVQNCIPFVKKEDNKGIVEVVAFENYHFISKYNLSHTQLVQNDKTKIWNLILRESIIDKFKDMHVLGDYCYMSYGLRPNSDEKSARGEFKKEDLISNVIDNVPRREYIEAKDVEKYKVKRVRYLEYGTERSPAKLTRPTFPELYEHPKLMFNVLGELQGTMDVKGNLVHNHSLIACVLWNDLKGVENNSISGSIKKYSTMARPDMEELSKTVDLRFLLGVLLSKNASELLRDQRSGDYHIYPEHLRNIPIPEASKEEQQEIINLVEQALSHKTDDLLEKIDLKVKELYDKCIN